MIKNRVIYGLLLLLDIAFLYFYGGLIPYTILYTLIILPIVSFILFRISLKFTEIDSFASSLRVVKNTPFKLTITVFNKGIVVAPFITVYLYNDNNILGNKAAPINISAYPFKTHKTTLSLSSPYRGKYGISIRMIKYYDFLGLFFKRTLLPRKYITVLPTIVPIEALTTFNGESFDTVTNNRFKTPDLSEVEGVRDYVNGDSLRFMHWKLSAKKDNLLIKEFALEQNTNITIILDISNKISEIKEQDKLIEKAASLLNYCYKNDIKCSLKYYNNSLQNKGMVHLDMENLGDYYSLYETLAVVKFCETPPLKKIVTDIIYSKNAVENIAIISQDKSANLLKQEATNLHYTVINI
ncbi:MAG: DUF58 domain-containing protein [Clostridia bacterium]